MRILWWSERFWPFVGGIETLGYELLPALQAMGHEVEVVTSHSDAELPDTDEFQSIPIHRFHFLTALHHRKLGQIVQERRRLLALKQRFCPDIVHIHFSGPSALFHWQTPFSPCQTLVSLHSLPAQISDRCSILTTSLRQADWVSSVSAHMLSLLPIKVAKSSVVYNGMAAPPLLQVRSPHSHLSIAKAPVLLCIGRMVAWKRFIWAVELFADIHREYEGARLVLVGDGAERAALAQKVADLDLQDSVTFTGILAKEDIYQQLADCTLVLLPSNATENIPYTAIESSWAARPVVASNVSGLPEIVVDGKTGYLVDPMDKSAWRSRIRHLLDNPEYAERLGQQAHQHVSQKFSLNRCRDEYDRLYRQLYQQTAQVNHPIGAIA